MRIRKFKSEHVTILSQDLSRDSRLSWKARGIFLYLWSQSDNWDFNAKEVATHAKDGRKALDSGLDELKKFGYLKRARKRNKLGRLGNSEWLLSDTPVKEWLEKSESPNSENREQVPPNSGFPNLDNPNLENPTLENGNQRYHQEKITSKEDNTKESTPLTPLKGGGQIDPKTEQAKEVIDYLNQQAGTNFRTSGQASQRIIKARLKDGFTVDDCKKVIDIKVKQWGHDRQMAQYLRPSTLFRPSKFEGYLNEGKNYKAPSQMGADDYINGMTGRRYR